MPKKTPELQIPLEGSLDYKEGKHGKIFRIQIAHYNPMWIPVQKLSKGSAESHLIGSPLPKKSYAVLARSYSKPPLKMKTKSITNFFGKRGQPKVTEDESDPPPEKKRSRSDGDVAKTKEIKDTPKKKRNISKMLTEAWCGRSRVYIKKFNVILDRKILSDLVKLLNEAKEELKPNKECDHLFSSEKFLTGTIVKHNEKNINCLRTTTTPGGIRCEVCDESFKVSRQSRAINHCFHKTHIEKLKIKQAEKSNLQQKGGMETFTKEGNNEKTITRRVQNFVAQQIALKGLPFTADECNKLLE